MRLDVKIDTSKFDSAMKQFAANSKRESSAVLRQQAKLFVRDIVRVTPPATPSSSGSAARKLAENLIRSELLRIFKPSSEDTISQFRDFYNSDSSESQYGFAGAKTIGTVKTKILTLAEMPAWHKSRKLSNGRVMKINRNVTTGHRKRDLKGLDTGIVSEGDFKKYLAEVYKRIGWLASGWNATALRLGVALPAWIARHGTSNGSVVEVSGGSLGRITMSNNVKYGSSVKGFVRRVQWALNNRALQMNKQLESFAMRKAAKAAGFK